ncbi:hypothetical protein BWQ96_09596 [Gracilariopsis chorda]|uniref:Uncharacterized protein n=1 Tax=Gracilariopsis chorda TaxID=448386 RepID=A0A2V3IF50_9FLOR|nr:hypothetical protein BWQ96_09596 [Gracilariopsis chorda]|eukprot:PXF40694.1 hypothetical protein BWQ96_09596 [Gracilariopsis chorda]
MERVLGISQMFIRCNKPGNVQLIIAKATDDFLIYGIYSAMKNLAERLKQRFKVDIDIIDYKIQFDGCEIAQDETKNITLALARYLERLTSSDVSRAQRKQRKGVYSSANMAGMVPAIV